MIKEKATSGKMVKIPTMRASGAHANGSEWSNVRLEQWATHKDGEPAYVYKLKQMLLTMIREGKAVPDGTDREGNPTFTFR